jgi:myo-inositol-1(or 4)-monophosphatase
MLDDTYAAVRGEGATKNGASIAVGDHDTLEGVHIYLDHGIRAATVSFHASVRGKIAGRNIEIAELECSSLEICNVASGDKQACVHWGLAAWDIAAATLIATEAGAKVTDLRGRPKDLFAPGIIVSAPGIADELAAITAPLLDEVVLSA